MRLKTIGKPCSSESLVSGCSLDVSRNTNGTNRPVFINFQGEMVIPKTGSISLARGKSILLLCAGSINHLNHGEELLHNIFYNNVL